MGKTAAGAVWLNADMLSPYDYWQFWRNTEDADVGRFLKLFTTLPLRRDRPARGACRAPEINEAKKVLATEATALLHGREAAGCGRRNRAPAPSRKARSPTTLPTIEIPRGELDAGIGVLTAFVQGRPGRLERRGAAPDQGRRPARQRRRRHRREDDADAVEI